MQLLLAKKWLKALLVQGSVICPRKKVKKWHFDERLKSRINGIDGIKTGPTSGSWRIKYLKKVQEEAC